MWIPDYQFNVLSGFFWQATYKRNDLQKNEKKKQLPRVEKVLIYYLGICMRLSQGSTAGCI
jgi:hypothetical protein